jgi:hypothetical protein
MTNSYFGYGDNSWNVALRQIKFYMAKECENTYKFYVNCLFV